MLSRSLVPLSRLRLAQPATRIATISIQSRSYARSKDYFLGDQRDYKTPPTAAKPAWQQNSSFASKPPKEPLRRVPGSEEDLKLDDANGFQASRKPLGRRPPEELEDDIEPPPPTRPTESSKISEEPPQEFEPLDAEPTPQQPQQPLPDLTRGIPPTLAAELEKAQSQHTASRRSLNITEEPSDPTVEPGEGTGDRAPRGEYVSSSDKKKNAAVKYTYLFLAAAFAGYAAYLGRNWDSEEEEKKYAHAPSGWGPALFYNRVKARMSSTMSYYNDPVTTKLLPEEDPNFRLPFTLVLSLEDMLVHQEWTREKGWRIAKRPGLDYFLRYLSQYYELVLFTSQPSAMGDQVMRKLDPYQMVRWPLYREATLYKDGGYIKDLAYLNRDLKKVMIIDTVPHHVKNQPENAILLPKWKGDPNDQTLIQLIPFLEYVATMGFDDARTVLKSFEGKYIPAEFARREKLLREKFEQQQAAKGKPKRKLSVGSWFKQKSPDGLPSLDEAEAQGKMLWDVLREQGQKNYQELEKRIKEEGEKWLAEKEAEEKRMQEEAIKNMKSGWFGMGGKKE